jgi:hypothetical protein
MPYPNIDQFRTALATGGVRPNLFSINCTFPSALVTAQNSQNTNAQRKLFFTARAASIPEDSVGQIGVGYFGRVIKLPGDRTFANWTTTVINDEDYLVRNTLEQWHSGINDIIDNNRDPAFALQSGYKTIVNVVQYNKVGDPIKSYDLYGAWPINLAGMNLDWSEQNTIQEFSVTWSYDYWLPNNILTQ